MPLAAGDRVTVRGERWVVDAATAYADATLLHLSSDDERHVVRHCQLLAPFDRPVPSIRRPTVRAVRRRRWMHCLRSQMADLRASTRLRAPQQAAIDILPFQLEPALALAAGRASRFLLADEVGLGKTIQGGLMLSELRQRGWCERALIVTPAGLRQQWADELLQKFEIRAAIIDAAALAALTESLPFDVNPWGVEPVAITSIDFIKQPEVLRGLAALLWDMLIVDEAHQATLASQRYDAVNAVATRARHVVLLTATPHAGDDVAYRALCAIGNAGCDDPMVLFRRTREMAGLPRSRRAHLLPVRSTHAGIEMFRLLDTYIARLWNIARHANRRDVQLVAMVLAKRAFSSARSLQMSLERRLAGLSGESWEPAQAPLPLVFDEDPSDEPSLPAAPAFERQDEERATVRRLIDAARRAQDHEPKMQAICRIVRRVHEPLVIFTEYRDTLEAMRDRLATLRSVTTLHGGQTPHERRLSVRAFTEGAADLLIATDAGSEGLNLHGRCRLVVNLELPWNPIRLEQRAGRVDRIGQTRTVHVINLLAGGTAERTVLARLMQRLDRIRMSEVDIASAVIDRSPPPPQPAAVAASTSSVDYSGEAEAEAVRIASIRRSGAAPSPVCTDIMPVTVVRSPHTALVAFVRIRFAAGTGRVIEDALVPVGMRMAAQPRRLRPAAARGWAESLIAVFGLELVRVARARAEQQARTLALESAPSVARAIRRERAIVACATAPGPLLVQGGLFDGRAVKRKATDREQHDAIRRDSQVRGHLLAADASIHVARDPEIALLLFLCSSG